MTVLLGCLLLTVVALTALVTDATQGWSNCTGATLSDPHVPSGAVKVCRDGVLAIAYDTEMIDPAFSAYYIRPKDLTHIVTGRDNFYEDPDLEAMGVAQAPVDSHAFNFSWQKGHLCPSHIMSRRDDTKHSTYTMANVAPQSGIFNMRAWNHLETGVLDWITNNNRPLHIITGIAYLSRSNVNRTDDDIAIPDYYFKVICDQDSKKSAGFWGWNTLDDRSHHVTGPLKVKEVEKIYGGELFPTSHCKTDDLDKSYWSGIN